jgi:hypothetical protein
MLVNHLKTRCRNIAFMVESSEVLAKVDALDSNLSLPRQTEKCHALWRELFKQAMLFLRKSDEREYWADEEIVGEESLIGYFEEWVRFEGLLYASYDLYRDHTIHTMRNYLLGDYCLSHPSFGRIREESGRIRDSHHISERCQGAA